MAKRIGAAFLGIIVTAGVRTSILLGKDGLAGSRPHAAEAKRLAGRLVGGALMSAGGGLVTRW